MAPQGRRGRRGCSWRGRSGAPAGWAPALDWGAAGREGTRAARGHLALTGAHLARRAAQGRGGRGRGRDIPAPPGTWANAGGGCTRQTRTDSGESTADHLAGAAGEPDAPLPGLGYCGAALRVSGIVEFAPRPRRRGGRGREWTTGVARLGGRGCRRLEPRAVDSGAGSRSPRRARVPTPGTARGRPRSVAGGGRRLPSRPPFFHSPPQFPPEGRPGQGPRGRPSPAPLPSCRARPEQALNRFPAVTILKKCFSKM
ncbi:collagen alpha-1(I) chain-like [Choloepus didactylus]|uniref:collagen alpha-1(I) chain-like n=1 Tax=Choloepus didactylus TaxID=27675 RepID=UPI00189C7057|nr:collagen alpha-1(I) chain-like [Choloepus didactylus]